MLMLESLDSWFINQSYIDFEMIDKRSSVEMKRACLLRLLVYLAVNNGSGSSLNIIRIKSVVHAECKFSGNFYHQIRKNSSSQIFAGGVDIERIRITCLLNERDEILA